MQSLIPGGSERFYLLVPPLSLTAYLLLAPDGWRELKKQLRPALVYLAALALFSAGYNLMQPCMVLPGTTLQIAHILALLLEHGRWLRNLLKDIDQDLMKLFGSLKNIFRRLLESIRHVYLGPDPLAAAAGPTDEDSS